MSIPSESVLIAWLPRCRWFRSKAEKLDSVTVEAAASFETGEDSPLLTVLKTVFADGRSERYVLPLDSSQATDGTSFGDASWDPRFRQALFEILCGQRKIPLGEGYLTGKPVASENFDLPSENKSRVLNTEQSNTSFVFDSGHFVKLYRRIEEGVHPETEILRFLREHTDYSRVPRFCSSLEWERTDKPPVTVALMQEFAPSNGGAWEHVLQRLQSMREKSETDIPKDLAGWISLLGRRIAELHAALASRPDVPGFAPEILRSVELDEIRGGIRRQLNSLLATLEAGYSLLNAEAKPLAGNILDDRSRLYFLLENSGSHSDVGSKIRTHGDLHLGQILVAPDDVWILDFEGEPSRTLEENRRKHSPLRDAAGMLRSFHYAVSVAARSAPETGGGTFPSESLPADLGNLFLKAYYEGIAASNLPPADDAERKSLLNLFMLEKAVYEALYELNNRPDWAVIPLQGLAELLKPSAGFRVS